MKKVLLLLLSIVLSITTLAINSNSVKAESDVYLFKIGIGEWGSLSSTENVKDGSKINVSDVSSIENKLWIENINKSGSGLDLTKVGTGTEGVKDGQGRFVLEVQGTKSEPNFKVFNFIYHAEDDTQNTTAASTFGNVVGLNRVMFYTNDFRGVQLNNNKMPDMFDDMVHSSVGDLAGTDINNPTLLNTYYDETSVGFESSLSGKTISNVEMAYGEDNRIATIDQTTKDVTFKSPFYNSIPLKVTLSDSTEGYITLEKIGIEINDYRSDVPNTNHGSQIGCALTDDGKEKLIVTFYYDSSNTYNDYNMVAKLTYADGSTETKIVSGFGEVTCVDSSLKGGDYIIWQGTSNKPVSASVTAVKAGATSGDTFGGALFGSGNGVTWTPRPE